MRCPYCGTTNGDQAKYCVHCGRDMSIGLKTPPTNRPQPPNQPPSSSSQPSQRYPAPPAQPQSSYQPSGGRPGQVTQGRAMPPVPPQQPQQSQQSQSFARSRPQPTPASAPEPPAPAPFPPKNVQQLKALEQGALAYNVLNTTTNAMWKKTVRIAFPRCAPWQQVATLLKALEEQLSTDHETFVVQGVLPHDSDVYGFTNGQITFDRHARLGSQTMVRYLVETNDGFASDAVRVVLTE